MFGRILRRGKSFAFGGGGSSLLEDVIFGTIIHTYIPRYLWRFGCGECFGMYLFGRECQDHLEYFFRGQRSLKFCPEW